MKINVIPVKELSESMKQRWIAFQASNPSVAGPRLHPEVFKTAGNIMPHIYVALIYEGKDILGFLPFRKDQNQIAWPIEFCHSQAIIGPPKQRWDIDKILKQSDLKAWKLAGLVDFENIKSKKGLLKKFGVPQVDLTNGFEEYIKHKPSLYKNLMKEQRRMEREIGPIHFVPVCDDNVEVLHALVNWKVLQFNRDLTWAEWNKKFMESIYFLRDPLFKGNLSALYAGEHLLAASYDLSYQGIRHCFSSAYNSIFSKYSPGSLLQYYIISKLHTFQCKFLTMGYIFDFANSAVPTAEGTFEVISFKERIKSIKWLYQGLKPLVQAERRALVKLGIKNTNRGFDNKGLFTTGN